MSLASLIRPADPLKEESRQRLGRADATVFYAHKELEPLQGLLEMRIGLRRSDLNDTARRAAASLQSFMYRLPYRNSWKPARTAGAGRGGGRTMPRGKQVVEQEREQHSGGAGAPETRVDVPVPHAATPSPLSLSP